MTIRKVTPDKEQARSLFATAQSFIRSIMPIKDSAEASFLINAEYDILHSLCSAILAYDGEKPSGKNHHKILITRIGKKYNLSPAQMHLFDEIRKIRNDINYYGQKEKEVLEDFYQRNKKNILILRQTILDIIQKKLGN